jgi:hypothetical protein
LASIGMILLMIAVWTPCIILYIISN